MATIRERRLFRSALAQVRRLFESGVYSRGASIRSYTVYVVILEQTAIYGQEIEHPAGIRIKMPENVNGISVYALSARRDPFRAISIYASVP